MEWNFVHFFVFIWKREWIITLWALYTSINVTMKTFSEISFYFSHLPTAFHINFRFCVSKAVLVRNKSGYFPGYFPLVFILASLSRISNWYLQRRHLCCKGLQNVLYSELWVSMLYQTTLLNQASVLSCSNS